MVACDVCGVALERQHMAVVILDPKPDGDSELAFLCPRDITRWAAQPEQQDALARAEGRPAGIERPRSGTEG